MPHVADGVIDRAAVAAACSIGNEADGKGGEQQPTARIAASTLSSTPPASSAAITANSIRSLTARSRHS